jgi:hypothetical protein
MKDGTWSWLATTASRSIQPSLTSSWLRKWRQGRRCRRKAWPSVRPSQCQTGNSGFAYLTETRPTPDRIMPSVRAALSMTWPEWPAFVDAAAYGPASVGDSHHAAEGAGAMCACHLFMMTLMPRDRRQAPSQHRPKRCRAWRSRQSLPASRRAHLRCRRGDHGAEPSREGRVICAGSCKDVA